MNIKNIVIWSDSEIALHWLNENVADFAARGVNSRDFNLKKSTWLTGLDWLGTFNEYYSDKISVNCYTCCLDTAIETLNFDRQSENVLNLENFNSYHKAFNTLAYVLRFVNNLKFKIKKSENVRIGHTN